MRSILLATLALATAATASAQETDRWTLELRLGNQQIQGAPLAWDDSRVELLLRDGSLLGFAADDATDFRKSSSSFQAYSVGELRRQLAHELGGAFEISGTGHYLVAHPNGQGEYWSPRFEELYRSFVHYFSARGFRLSKPEFPLVAVVFRTQQEFQQYARKTGTKVPSDVLGYYSPQTNRISLFDVSGGNADQANWQEHAETIIHEATHQSAFNTGIHQRFAQPPLWVVEGLATMFEAPGVWDSRQHPARPDRLNQGRLNQFKQYLTRRKSDSLIELVSSDRRFEVDSGAAYAESWAFSFFLVETQARKYCDYLAKTAQRPAFKDYPANERVADFVAVFGNDFKMLDAYFLRFMADLE